MDLHIVESSVLKICKRPIQTLGGLADHYYLCETTGLTNSLGWGPNGLELQGTVRITPQELERVELFLRASRYSVAIHNCEHFAHYVLHGINFSSQQNTTWKSLGAEVLAALQPTQTIAENCDRFLLQQAAARLMENLRQAKIEKANQERIAFWQARGVSL
jgi:hypothetical protein